MRLAQQEDLLVILRTGVSGLVMYLYVCMFMSDETNGCGGGDLIEKRESVCAAQSSLVAYHAMSCLHV